MWNDLLHVQIPLADKVIRTIAVYLALLLILRVVGKRQVAQLNQFDLVVMLLLSNVVQNAIIGPDNSLSGGIFGAVVLIAVNSLLNRLTAHSNRLATLLEGRPTVLAHDGEWDERALTEAGIRRADVEAAIRRQGADNVGELESLTLEPGGAMVTTLRPEEEGASRADVARLEAKLDALLARVSD
jgi:uncharacterized membrane protein YcaP (DUF421 family)